MRYLLALLFVTGIFSGLLNAQTDSVCVKFRVKAYNLEEGEKIFISGNYSKLGGWQPDSISLNGVYNGIWELNVRLPKDFIAEYKFTKGSWESEASNEQGNIFQNNVLKVTKDTTVVHVITHWKNEFDKIQNAAGQVTGKVCYHDSLTFKGLLPRDMIVWLPPGYDAEDDKHYPVLYMHDGQNLFDPATSSFGVDWGMDEVADSLINIGEIEPLIIVGINNTANRYSEYSNSSDTGYVYMDFLVNKIKPMIDSTYKTLPDRKNTAVAGSSMGGLISFMLAWEYPEVFSKAACFSPAFKYERFDFVSVVNKFSDTKKPIIFYIDNGGIGIEEIIQPGIDEMISLLEAKGYVKEKDLFVVFDKEARHFESAWGSRVHVPLKLFFGKE